MLNSAVYLSGAWRALTDSPHPPLSGTVHIGQPTGYREVPRELGSPHEVQRFGIRSNSCGTVPSQLPIVKQGEFELAADLGWVRHIQEELNSAVPMGPTSIFR
jgi:hypothetical protein